MSCPTFSDVMIGVVIYVVTAVLYDFRCTWNYSNPPSPPSPPPSDFFSHYITNFPLGLDPEISVPRWCWCCCRRDGEALPERTTTTTRTTTTGRPREHVTESAS